MTEQEKLRAKVKVMKDEAKAEKQQVKKEVEQNLAIVRKNTELTQMYKDNANVGTQNLGGQSPLLKVHTQGKSSTNELADGNQPNDGWFYYKPTGEQFKEVECHILTISRGFKADGMKKSDGTIPKIYNQLMAGVIINGNQQKPFITYLTGKKLKPMWEFGKLASKYTRAKPLPIPMFALKVKLTTYQEKSDFGFSWIINFEIMKNEDGSPVVVTDQGLFQFLIDHVETVEDTIAKIIATKEPEEPIEDIPHPAETVKETQENPSGGIPF